MSSSIPPRSNDGRDGRTGAAATGADGATRVAAAPNRNKWLWPLLAALAVLALILLLSRCGNDDTPAAPAVTTSPSAATTPSASVSDTMSPSVSDTASVSPSSTDTSSASPSDTASAGGAGGTAGTITSEGATLLGGSGVGDLVGSTGNQAVARSVKVESVPADEGFWVGTSTTDRVWVQLTGQAGESGYTVKKGDSVDFTGVVTPAASGFATKVGLSAAEGAALLTGQKQYIAVQKSELKLSS